MRRWTVFAIWMAVGISAVGCGGPYTGSVSGTVKFKGKPLPGGVITFIHPDSRIEYTQIKEDGSFLVPNAPGGQVSVTVATVAPIPAMPDFLVPKALKSGGGRKAQTKFPTGKYVRIPDGYAEKATSGLELTVKRGSQIYDVELKE